MCALKVSELAKDLRSLADSVERRLWVASPYIGSWKAVRKILGSAWQKVDVRLLTDKDSGILAQDTFEQFAAHRPVRSLEGLHAKLYIVDDSVLITSANLTETAFTRRHEVGLVLKGQRARGLVAVYEGLWDFAAEVDAKEFSFTKPRSGNNVDEAHRGGKLPKLYDLPAAPVAAPKDAGAFADYPHFLEVYRRFADDYLFCGAPDRPAQPLYLETDKLLNFLFHEDDGKPSREYTEKRHRDLSDSKRINEIRKYRARYRRSGLKGGNHSATAKLVHQYLALAKVKQLNKSEVETVAKHLNCFGNRLALSRFLKGNDLDTIRKSWSDLIHGSGEVKFRMNNCSSALFGFGKSAIQETLGYYDPAKYPLRNANTNAGLRFLGYNVK
jgi:PLD-like domain